MRHQTDDVARFIAEPCNAVDRSVWVRRGDHFTGRAAVPKDDLPIPLESIDDLRRCEVIAFTVRDRNPQNLPRPAGSSERSIGLLDADVHMLATKLETSVPERCARKKSRLEQDLKPVADAKDRTAPPGKCRDLAHHWRKTGDGAGSQVVAMRKPPWQDHNVGAVEIAFLVPHKFGVFADDMFHGVVGIVIAVGSGKDDDSEFHDSLCGGGPAPRHLDLVTFGHSAVFVTTFRSVQRFCRGPATIYWLLSTSTR